MQEKASKMRHISVYVSVRVCEQEINNVVHELHPSARVKGLFADNISSQQGAAASCSTLSSFHRCKILQLPCTPGSALSLTVIFNPSIPKIINLTALLTILHTSNTGTSLIALSRPISFLLLACTYSLSLCIWV